MNKKNLSCASPVMLKPIMERTQSLKGKSRNSSLSSSESCRIQARNLKNKDKKADLCGFHVGKSEIGLSIDTSNFGSYLSENTIKQAFINEGAFDRLMLTTPSARKDVKKIIEWLDAKLTKLAQGNYDEPNEMFEMANEIYSSCLTEVIKQVASHCKERGYLISRVWQAYKNLFEKALSLANAKYKLLQDQVANEKQKIHRIYSQKILESNAKIEEITNNANSISCKVVEYENTIAEGTKKEAELNDYIGLLQARYKALKFENLQIREEIRITKIRYQNVTSEEIKPEKKISAVPKRFIRKSTQDLLKRTLEDPVLSPSKCVSNEIIKMIYSFGIF